VSDIEAKFEDVRECLPYVEIAYNRAEHSTTKVSPFQVVYGFNPRAPIDLLPLTTTERVHTDANERADFILKLHASTKENIERMTEKYRLVGSQGRKEVKLEPGDLVWLHLRNDRFSDLRKSKLMPRVAGPYKILEKINDNAYKLELPPEFGISPTFNILDLKPYLGEEDELESRTTPLQEGEDDEDITLMDTNNTQVDIQGPITRARARQLNLQVISFLHNYSCAFESSMLPNNLIVLRNEGDDQQRHGKDLGGVEDQRGRPDQDGSPNQFDIVSVSDSRNSPY
jgi:hypothetical protein